jgi:hypothetical protein
MSAQHARLSPERWAAFDFGQRILMIANELHRATKLAGADDGERRRNSMERVLALADLTIEVESRPARLRELLRWREIAGERYLATDPALDRRLLRALLQLSPTAAPQVELLAT